MLEHLRRKSYIMKISSSAIFVIATLAVTHWAYGTEIPKTSRQQQQQPNSQQDGTVKSSEGNQTVDNLSHLFDPDQDLKWLNPPVKTIQLPEQQLEELASENLQALLPIVGLDGSSLQEQPKLPLEQLYFGLQQNVPQYDSTHLLLATTLPVGKRRFDDNAALASTGQSRGNRFLIPTNRANTEEFNNKLSRRNFEDLQQGNRSPPMMPKYKSRGKSLVNMDSENNNRRSSFDTNRGSLKRRRGVNRRQDSISISSYRKAAGDRHNGNYRQEGRKQSLKEVAKKQRSVQDAKDEDDGIFKDDNDEDRIDQAARRPDKRSDYGAKSGRNNADDDSPSGDEDEGEDDNYDEPERANSKSYQEKNSRILRSQSRQHNRRESSNRQPYRKGGRSDNNDDDDSNTDAELESEEDINSSNIRALAARSPAASNESSNRDKLRIPDVLYNNNQLAGGSLVGARAAADLTTLTEFKPGGGEVATIAAIGDDVVLGDNADEANSSATHLKSSASDLQAAAGHHHHGGGGHHGHYYQYVEVPKKKAWKFGFKRGNHKHTIERHEKGYKNKFHSSFKWHAKEKCKKKKCESKGKMTWHYEHHDKKHHG